MSDFADCSLHTSLTALFETVTLQLKSKAVTVKAGTLVDATILAFADSAYRGNHFRDAVLAKGGVPRIVATGMWGRVEAETLRKLHAWDQPIHRVRGRIEKIFGTWKRSYGLR